MGESGDVKKTPFYNKHIKYGARIVPFAGYLMPLQYTSIMEEHRKVRESVGVFDVSHMGEFTISGESAEGFLNYMTVNDVSKLEIGQVQYNAMCYPDGGIVDDLLVYKFSDYYMMVVNASNIEKDFDWLKEHLVNGIELKNVSDKTGLLAIQGPNSSDVLQPLTDVDLSNIPYYHFVMGKFAGTDMVISRTGYTGEKGFELYHSPDDSECLWDEIFRSGQKFGIQPIGLGARDTLRLEMKYCLYGNDIDKDTNPLEAGLSWVTKLDKDDFIGKDALIKIKESGVSKKLIAFEMLGKAIPRPRYKIYYDDEKIGFVTSGTQSPILNKGIGLGYVSKEYCKSGTEVFVEIRGRLTKAKIVKPPFVPSRVI
jgi:aminomethyltransferase